MRHTPCAQHIPVGSDYWLTMAPFTSGLTQALTRIPFGAVWFSSSQWRRWLEPFLVPCCFALLTALTRSSSGFSSKASIIRIGSWHGPSAAQPEFHWAEQSNPSVWLFFFLFLSKVCEIKFLDPPQVYLGFSEVCIIIIFSNPLSSWLPHDGCLFLWTGCRCPSLFYHSYWSINAWPPLFSSPCSIFQEKPLPPVGVVSEVVGCYS